MHNKYSTLLNITFVTSMFGLGMPILYPIALLSVTILYLVEKFMLFYGYRQPPMYDGDTYVLVIRVLLWAPIFFCLTGYWMLSSKQLLSNDYLSPITYSNQIPETYHVYTQVFSAKGWVDPAWPLLLFGLLILLMNILRAPANNAFDRVLQLFGCGKESTLKLTVETSEVEDAQYHQRTFWKVLTLQDAMWIECEHEMAKKLGIQSIPDESYERFWKENSKFKQHTHQLIGAPCYNLLAEPSYQKKFAYVPCSIENRNELV